MRNAADAPLLQKTKPRVLHVLGSLAMGGIETWLMHVLRHERDGPVSHEFLLTKEEPGPYEAEVRAMGIPIHKVPFNRDLPRWVYRTQRFLKREGPFAAVHSHPTLAFSAFALVAAKAAGVPIRIAHNHEARSLGRDHRTIRHRLLKSLALFLFDLTATRRIGITEAAIEELAGPEWRSDPQASILLYGFDFSQHDGAPARARRLREALGIADTAPIVGSVARFDPVKNHAFLLDVFADLKREIPEAQLVLVGRGPLQPRIAARVAELGISDSVHFAGTTDDVPAYMALFDLFVLSSFSEGLGIVCVEAQAAGTRVIASDTIPAEAAVVPGGLTSLSLDRGIAPWKTEMARLLRLPKPDAAEWRRVVEQSSFSIDRCVRDLNEMYRQELEKVA